MDFSNSLINWYIEHKRNLPWRKTQDPYFIWLSEIILQQTRVAQGLAYYNAFTTAYPSVFGLAAAPEEEVMKLWQGLGYYSRARNLHAAAKQVVADFDGVFPSSYADIKALKGVGDYTAAAVASFAYGLPHAVLDGNVFRVLSRLFDIETPIDSSAGKKEFQALATELLDKERPADFNQAIMEFGALQCVPKNPNCTVCVLNAHCASLAKGTVLQRPIKKAKVKQRNRYFYYVIPVLKNTTCLGKRNNAKDIWQNLFEFPLIETDKPLAPEVALSDFMRQFGVTLQVKHISAPIKHVLSHQVLHSYFVVAALDSLEPFEKQGYKKVPVDALSDYAVPRLIDRFLEQKSHLLA